MRFQILLPNRKKNQTQMETKGYQIAGSLQWKDNRGVFYKNIIVGALLAVFLHLFFLNTKLGEESVNQIFDQFLINRETKQIKRMDAVPNGGITFITIHPEEHRMFTPREQIAKAVRLAYEAGAKVIIPDFLFEFPDYQQPEADNELRRVLAEVADKPGISLILPVRTGYQDDQKTPEIKSSIFNDIAETATNIYEAFPGIASSTREDPYGRYWRAYETGSQREEMKVLWGLPLLAAVLAQGDIEDLTKMEPKILNNQNMGRVELNLSNRARIHLTGEQEDPYYQRIRYRLVPENVLKHKDEGTLGIYENLPLDIASLLGDKTKIFRDKIVIIGNINPDFGDTHLTPVGEMPGMYLLGNAINTLNRGLQVSGAPLWFNLIFDLAIILFCAAFFTYIPTLISGVFRAIDISLLISILGMVLSFLFIHFVGYRLYLHYGIFLNSNLLIFMIGFYETVVNMEELLVNVSVKWIRKERGS
jgi:CHASE2 domain-containing sensor protein